MKMKLLLLMMAAALLLVVGTVLTSCTPQVYSYTMGHKYQYRFTKENKDTALVWEDDKMRFSFDITDKELNLVARNKSQEPQKIIWDEGSLVLHGKAEKIMHKGVKYTDRNTTQTPSVVPPQAELDDVVVPTENVSYKEGYYGKYVSSPGGWVTEDLLLTQDRNKPAVKELIMSEVGSRMSLYLPVQDTKGQVTHYNFQFLVSEVNCVTCKQVTQKQAKPSTKKTAPSKSKKSQ